MAKGSGVKPTHKVVKTYYAALEAYADQSVEHGGAVRSAFQNLLADTEPAHEDFNKAVGEFKQRVPDFARGARGESKATLVARSSTPAGLGLSGLRLTGCEQNPNMLVVTSAMPYHYGADADGWRVACPRNLGCTHVEPRLGYPPHTAVFSPRGPHGVVGVDMLRVTG